MLIKEFTPDQAFTQIYKSIFPKVTDMNGIFGNKSKWYQFGELVAFCTVGIVDDTKIFVYNVAVMPDERRKGYGNDMLRQVLTQYSNFDIYLFVECTNFGAIRLYKKLNFKRVSNEYVPPNGHVCLKLSSTSALRSIASVKKI
jgi:ribosomal protein S18 acetylase RimI-like enzyme